jgi:hypothetical protein
MYDIYFDLANMHQTVQDANEEFDFDLELDLPSELGDDDYAVIVHKPVVCSKCGEIYPYADPNQDDGSFKCYSCRKWG